MAEDYFSHPRPEVRSLVPPTARFLVDVGCGAGALGAALKRDNPLIAVRGIELDPAAAARAAAVLDDVAVMPGDGALPDSWPAPDCIILADVLEHMTDPWTVLRRWRTRLRKDGHIVVSLPNVSHRSVLDALRRGRWDYVDEGILDKTHVRFFTRETALELVEDSGFEIEIVRRGIERRVGTFRERIVWPQILLGLSLEERGHRLPALWVRMLDASSRQILLRARVK